MCLVSEFQIFDKNRRSSLYFCCVLRILSNIIIWSYILETDSSIISSVFFQECGFAPNLLRTFAFSYFKFGHGLSLCLCVLILSDHERENGLELTILVAGIAAVHYHTLITCILLNAYHYIIFL